MNRYDIIVVNVFDDIIDVEAPQQHVEPKLHDIDVPLTEQVPTSSSKKPLLLDPRTPTPIPPSPKFWKEIRLKSALSKLVDG